MGKYWNGYRWCETHDPTVEERAALLEAEVNPPEVTGEHEPLVSYEMEATVGLKVEVLPEQPTPNMVSIPLTLHPEKVVYAPLKEIPEEEEKKDVVFSDEVRERIRKELSGGSGRTD